MLLGQITRCNVYLLKFNAAFALVISRLVQWWQPMILKHLEWNGLLSRLLILCYGIIFGFGYISLCSSKYSLRKFYWYRMLWKLYGLLHTLVRSSMAWYLINGKKWDGREEIHQLISGSFPSLAITVPLHFALPDHFGGRHIQLLLKILLVQRSWIHFFGESVVLCKDLFGKILTWLFNVKFGTVRANDWFWKQVLSVRHYIGFLFFAIAGIFSTSIEKARRKASWLGISICRCWCKYHFHDHANAWSRCM